MPHLIYIVLTLNIQAVTGRIRKGYDGVGWSGGGGGGGGAQSNPLFTKNIFMGSFG